MGRGHNGTGTQWDGGTMTRTHACSHARVAVVDQTCCQNVMLAATLKVAVVDQTCYQNVMLAATLR